MAKKLTQDYINYQVVKKSLSDSKSESLQHTCKAANTIRNKKKKRALNYYDHFLPLKIYILAKLLIWKKNNDMETSWNMSALLGLKKTTI